MKNLTIILLLILIMVSTEILYSTQPVLAQFVELDSYLGKWYEFAKFPNRFQKDCTNSTATYTLRRDGKIEVFNQCIDKSGKEKSIKGKAWIADAKTNAKLKVQFFWPFRADYWIIGIADDYEWAIVSGPSKKYLWILTRNQYLNQNQWEKINDILTMNNFEIDKLEIYFEVKD